MLSSMSAYKPNYYNRLAIIAALTLSTSCSNVTEPEVLTQLLLNSNMETGETNPEHWGHFTTTSIDSPYEFRWATDEYMSENHSLMISLENGPNYNQISCWTQSVILTPGEYSGKNLILEASLMMKNVHSIWRGIFMSIDTYNAQGRLLKSTNTQDNRKILGTRYWYTCTLQQLNIPNNVRQIVVRVGLGMYTSGTVYFDDVTLSVLTHPAGK